MRYQRAYSDLKKLEALRVAKDWRKRKRVTLKLRKDPNGRYEIWVLTMLLNPKSQ